MSAIRQQLLEAVVTRLETISTGAGYITSAGAKVRLNTDRDNSPADEGDCPGITVRETGGNEMPGMVGENFGTLECDLIAHDLLTEEDDPDEVARDIVTDINVAIGTDKTFGGLADDCVLSGYNFNAVTRGKRVASITVAARLNYRTARFAPATAPS